jgi:hypothetical protein
MISCFSHFTPFPFSLFTQVTTSGIVPEQLPPAEDIKKIERRVEVKQIKLPKYVILLNKHECI